MFYFEGKDKREFMKGSNDFEILRSFSVSRDLEKSVQIQQVTVGNVLNMTSLEWFIHKKLEAENLAKSLLTGMKGYLEK